MRILFVIKKKKKKLLNLRDKRVWINMWGSLFLIYLQLYH